MLTIGQFSQACQITVKALHHYDRIGLLHPAFTDEQTGYRYYAVDQIDTVLKIRKFKRYGFSLQEIASLLADDHQKFLEALRQKKSVLERELLDLRMAIQDLDVMIERAERNTMTEKPVNSAHSIQLVTEPNQPVLSLRRMMGIGDFGSVYAELFETLKSHSIQPGITGARYHDQEFNPDSSDIEVFIVLDEKDSSAATDTIGGTLCAHIEHCGGYSSLSDSYAILYKWILENGYELNGAPYELYTVNGFHSPDPSSWKTEIYFPVVPAAENNAQISAQ